jgi:uncharacterized protein (TIGR02597 family)
MRAFFKSPVFSPFTAWRNWVGLSAVLAAMPLLSNAQTVTTVPVGAMTYTFPATTQVTTTYISIPLTNPSVYTLPVASLTANTITFSGTPFPAGGLAQTGSPFFARIATGSQAGRTILITANTTSAITVDSTDHSSQTTALDTSGWAVAVGDRIEIIVGDTLADLFGDGSLSKPLLFVGAAIAGQSDTVSIYNRTTAKFDTYYYNTTAGYWRSSTVNANANLTTVYPSNGLVITRRSGRSAVSLVVTGAVPSIPPLIKSTGSNVVVYVTTGYPIDLTLAQLNLVNWTKAIIAGQADTLSVYNTSTSKFDTYFQRSDTSLWQKSGAGSADQSATVLPAGSVVAILRRASITAGASFSYTPLPYSL